MLDCPSSLHIPAPVKVDDLIIGLSSRPTRYLLRGLIGFVGRDIADSSNLCENTNHLNIRVSESVLLKWLEESVVLEFTQNSDPH